MPKVKIEIELTKEEKGWKAREKKYPEVFLEGRAPATVLGEFFFKNKSFFRFLGLEITIKGEEISKKEKAEREIQSALEEMKKELYSPQKK